MAISHIFGLLLLLFAVISLFRKYLVSILSIGLVVFIIVLLVRWVADIFWWGKDRGKW